MAKKRIATGKPPKAATVDKRPTLARTNDSYANFMAKVGHGTGNQNDGSHYSFNPVSRNRLEMEWAYRGSWIIGRVVDCHAKDMTREGVTVNSSLDPGDLSKLDKSLESLTVWSQLCAAVKWSRLYGGSLGFLMIDGQDPATPLIPERLGKGQFKGVLPMDRWLLNPSLQDLVGDFGPDFGKPRFYQTVPDSMGMPLMNIHYSRVIRLEGVELPYWQRIAENLWGQSVLERMWDRLLAYDSTTTGAAQLVYKAHLRTLKVPQLREILSSQNDAMAGLMQQVAGMRMFQTNEGLTLLDKEDEFETHQYTFAGLDSVLMQFGEQLAGATDTPLVKLFGQSPGGFSTGETDLQSYNDNIKQAQVSALGPGVEKLYRVACISALGTAPPDEFSIEWKPLAQMTDKEKGELAEQTARAVGGMYEQQIIKRSTALEELKQSSKITGVFTNISDEEIQEAEQDPAPSPEALGLEVPEKPDPLGMGGKPDEEPKPPKDKNEYKPDDARPFKALDAEGVPRHEATGQFTHGMGFGPKRFDEKGQADDEGEWAESPLERVKSKSMREAIQAAHPDTCKAYGALNEIEPWKLQGTQRHVNVKIVGGYRRDHGEPITVAKRNGEHGIVDGHHRAVAAHLQGRAVAANIIDMDRAFAEAADCEAANPGLGQLGALHLATQLRLRNAPRPKVQSKDRWWQRFFGLTRDDYNPNEPRAPKGTETGGQWVKGGANPSKKAEPVYTSVGGKLGSNEGGTYVDQHGNKAYVKFYKNPQQGRTEQLASNINLIFGIQTHEPTIGKVNGKEAVISPWKELNDVPWPKVEDLTPKQRLQLAKMYWAAVLTKNWDVLGLDSSNIKMDQKGTLVQMDTGGSFEFRAQGKHKDYDDGIDEAKTFLNPSIPSGAVFSRLAKLDPKAFELARDEIATAVAHHNVLISVLFDKSGVEKAEALKTAFYAKAKKISSEALIGKSAVAAPTKPIAAKAAAKAPVPLNFAGQKLTTHQRLRRIMNEAHNVQGKEASMLIASVIKCPPPPLTPENKQAVGEYVQSSQWLNDSLRQAKNDYDSLSLAAKQKVKVLDEMMKSARDYALPIQVTRGLPLSVTKRLKKGDTFVDHGYSSTSFAKYVSKQFSSKAQLEIRLPKGFKFLSIPSFATAGGVDHGIALKEAEAILPRGTGFKVRKIETIGANQVYHVDAVFSSIQPPRDKWESSKQAKTKAKQTPPTDTGMPGIS